MGIVVTLQEKVNLQSIAAVQHQIVEAIEADADVALDISGVADADLSFVQLLEAARQYAAHDNKLLRLTQPASADCAALLERAGFLSPGSAETLDFWFQGNRPG
ncbi:STAS domain-containing protein [Rhizorhabdus sp. FW153]|uniref:STAS domain-containing protein n=1 Tax=Rhizorhabdus sp. FW153 TaxID=3400216 RepID=UPI003CEF344A